MTAGCWPFVAESCTACMYFLGHEPERVDGSGNRRPGWCRHRRVMMELVVEDGEGEDCPMFVPARRGSRAAGGLKPAA